LEKDGLGETRRNIDLGEHIDLHARDDRLNLEI